MLNVLSNKVCLPNKAEESNIHILRVLYYITRLLHYINQTKDKRKEFYIDNMNWKKRVINSTILSICKILIQIKEKQLKSHTKLFLFTTLGMWQSKIRNMLKLIV